MKSMKDWTLGELKDYCSTTKGCYSDCPFYKNLCDNFIVSPYVWNFKPEFFKAEIEYATMLENMFRKGMITRNMDGELKFYKDDCALMIVQNLFPSIEKGKSYNLKEIIEGAVKD